MADQSNRISNQSGWNRRTWGSGMLLGVLYGAKQKKRNETLSSLWVEGG